MPTNTISYPGVNVLEDGTLTSISGSSHTILSGGEYQDSRIRHTWPESGAPQFKSISNVEDEEEEEDRVLLGMPLLGTRLPPIESPTVQGTPQFTTVPMVEGNPGGPFAAVASQEAVPFASTSSPTAPLSAPHTPPPQASLPYTPIPSHTGSWPPIRPTGSSTHPSAPPKHTGTGSGSSHPGPGGSCALTALIAAIICLIISGIIGGWFFGIMPAMSVVGNSSVRAGEALHLHGYRFFPGSSISLTLDNKLQLSSASSTTGEARNHTLLPTALQMTVVDQFAASNTSVKADGSGSFDMTILANPLWGLGPHSIRATESFGSRSTVVDFTVVAAAAEMKAEPSALDFGKLELGSKAVLSVVVNNNGGQPLNWQATTGSATWLKLAPGTGTLQARSAPQFIYVTADTSQLKAGTYSATLTINSNGGSAEIGVNLQVIPQSSKPQAKINVSPNTLNFGTLDAGQQLTKALTVSNTGNLALNWKADTGNASWVSLDASSQTIQAGGLPDTINVTVDTTNLKAGKQSATLTINSNGGKAQIAITVVVNQAVQPCTLQAPSSTNESFNVEMGSNPAPQIFTIGVSGSCSNGVTITPSVTSGTSWLTVSPSSATITSGSVAFTINVLSSSLSPGSYSSTISLAAASGNSPINNSPQTVGVTLTVTEVPPVLAVSPTSLSYSLSNADSATSKSFSISNTGGAAMDWKAALDSKAPSFVSLSSSSGTGLAAGASVKVDVDVNPAGQTAGTYAATITVSGTDPITGQSVKSTSHTVSVTITITAAPSMQVSPTSLAFTPGNCVYTASGTVTVTNIGGGTLTWTVADPVYGSNQPTGWLTVSATSGSDDAGVSTTLTFSADGSSSQLVSGQTYTATVTITPSVGDAQSVSVSFTMPGCSS